MPAAVDAILDSRMPTDLTIQRNGEGAIIRAEAAEALPPALRRAAWRQALTGALGPGAGAVLVLTTMGYGVVKTLAPAYRPVAIGIMAGVTLAVYAIFALIFQGRRREVLARPLRQRTVLEVAPQRLRIESAGPYGSTDLSFTRTQIKDVKMVYGVKLRDLPGDDPRDAAAVFLQTGETLELLPGRKAESLKEAVRTIREIFDLQPVEAI
jgi:hypothetical protein